ncbi:hypothetical protein K491DRAFT_715812 [Lophiostoma macrostomum CBS 122681]|uniref:BTB domain-containing protein n=1 Tax=Lophiostoma macrostomum CBS 122681 TaxID=1314788 RepID=A0A6A6T7I5_9PLEO|nr:hypothetical protein K491DRAFT_715812 [Lophiostoma macrostomum CBS 122681]
MSASAGNITTGNAEPAVPTAPPKVKKSASPKVSLHEAADLTLIIGEEEQEVDVLKAAMQAASPVWRAMFKPEWAESKQERISFEEDDSKAMPIVLRIAHHKPESLPKNMPWDELLELAVICGKYDTIHIVRRHLSCIGWLQPYDNPAFFSVDWLFLAYTLGDYGKFQNRLELGRKHQGHDDFKRKSAQYFTFRRLLSSNVCLVELRESEKRKCRYMITGAVTAYIQDLGFLSASFGPLEKRPRSVNSYFNSLKEFYEKTYVSCLAHVECVKSMDIGDQVDKVMNDLKLVTDVQKRHMDIQAKQGT